MCGSHTGRLGSGEQAGQRRRDGVTATRYHVVKWHAPSPILALLIPSTTMAAAATSEALVAARTLLPRIEALVPALTGASYKGQHGTCTERAALWHCRGETHRRHVL